MSPKYLEATPRSIPTASNSLEPRYERIVAMPILDITLSSPLSIAFRYVASAVSASIFTRPESTMSCTAASAMYGLTAFAP